MMSPSFIRDLTLIARRRGLIAAVFAHALLASGFMLAWSGSSRVPVLTGANLYEQLYLVQCVFMTVAAPWIAARLMATERRGEWVRLAALLGQAPGRALAVRLVTVAVWTIVTAAAGLPAAILAQQMSGVTAVVLTIDFLTLVGCALGAAMITVHVELMIEDRLASWMLSSAIACAIFVAGRQTPFAPFIAAIVVAVVSARMMRWTNETFWYLADRRS